MPSLGLFVMTSNQNVKKCLDDVTGRRLKVVNCKMFGAIERNPTPGQGSARKKPSKWSLSGPSVLRQSHFPPYTFFNDRNTNFISAMRHCSKSNKELCRRNPQRSKSLSVYWSRMTGRWTEGKPERATVIELSLSRKKIQKKSDLTIFGLSQCPLPSCTIKCWPIWILQIIK